jgi:hypothetical protein
MSIVKLNVRLVIQGFYSTACHAIYDIHTNETYFPIQNIDLQRMAQDGKFDCTKSHRIENCSNIATNVI